MAVWIRRIVLGACFLFLLPAGAHAQETELVRGIITGQDKKPIEGVTVTVIGLLNQQQRITTTNAKGLYNVLFQDAEGEYIVSVRRIGYGPQSIHVLRSGLSPVLATNITLTEVAIILDDKTVVGNRSITADRDGRSIGGNDRDLFLGAMFSVDPTDLLALAANVPGVMMIKGANGLDAGYSVLGLGADANNLMVDGSVTNGNNIPSMAIAKATLATNTYDITRGGFAGASMSVTTKAGTDVASQNFSSSMTNRHLSWSDPTSSQRPPGSINGSLGAGGPIVKRRLKYFAAADMGDSRTDIIHLLNANPTLLAQSGVLTDSVDALRGILTGLHIPLSLSNAPVDRVAQRANVSLRFDFTPKANSSANMSLRGAWNLNGGPAGGTFSFPTSGSKRKDSNLSASLNLSGYVGGLLNNFNSSYSYSTSSGDPYLGIPSGSVRVGTVFDADRTGLTTLRFGSGAGVNKGDYTYASLTDQLSVLTTNSKHNMKIAAGLTYENSSNNYTGGPGDYSYQSLADLSAGKAGSYYRVIQNSSHTYSGLSWFFGPQDEWLVSDKLQFSVGLRTDMSRANQRIPFNPVVDSLFGVRNDVIPSSIGYSPRIGFSWTPNKGNPPKPSAAGKPGNGSMVSITGGVGLYRGSVSAQNIAALVDQTGLPNTTRYLNCVGDAVPTPVWSGVGDFSPESCADGSGPLTLTDSRPTVALYDPHYKPLSRWSADLGVNPIQLLGWSLSASGSYNLNINQSSIIDLNLRRDPMFSIAGEANRPVYVAPENIAPETGLIVQNAARVQPGFGQVSQFVSDLRGKYLQVNVALSPPRPLFGKIPFSMNYTWVPYARALQRGFGDEFNGGSTTDGDPFKKEWANGTQATHRISANTSFKLWWLTLSVRFDVASGLPYTPIVAGDINGDGSSNDRAFIYNPSLVSDTILASQLNSLLNGTTASARRCLQQQLGKIASRNSCRTPWYTQTNLQLQFTPPRTLGFGNRLKFSAGFRNAGSAIVRLFGMKNSILGGVQVSQNPDTRLLYVTGFDPSKQQFSYKVNQLFGLPQNYGNRASRLAPFQVQLGASLALGGAPQALMGMTLGLVPTKQEPEKTVDQVMVTLRGLSVDPVSPILKLSDSLRLTQVQADSIGRIGNGFWTQADSVFTPLAEFVASRGKRITDAELNAKLPAARAQVQALMATAKENALGVLTTAQKALYVHFTAPKAAGGGER